MTEVVVDDVNSVSCLVMAVASSDAAKHVICARVGDVVLPTRRVK